MADKHWHDTAEWQALEVEADADLAAGRYDDFESVDALIADLEMITDLSDDDRQANLDE